MESITYCIFPDRKRNVFIFTYSFLHVFPAFFCIFFEILGNDYISKILWVNFLPKLRVIQKLFLKFSFSIFGQKRPTNANKCFEKC